MPKNPKLKAKQNFSIIGQNAKRTDTLPKVNGTAQFALDVQLDGMLYATVVHSPVFGGKLKSFNEASVNDISGVTNIFEIESLEDEAELDQTLKDLQAEMEQTIQEISAQIDFEPQNKTEVQPEENASSDISSIKENMVELSNKCLENEKNMNLNFRKFYEKEIKKILE